MNDPPDVLDISKELYLDDNGSCDALELLQPVTLRRVDKLLLGRQNASMQGPALSVSFREKRQKQLPEEYPCVTSKHDMAIVVRGRL